MPRDQDGIIQQKWAESGLTQTFAQAGIDPSVGFPASYSANMGDKPTLELINYIFRILFSIAKEINEHGILEWNAGISYKHPAVCLRMGELRVSKRDSLNRDPLTQNNDWGMFETVLEDATTMAKGIAKFATESEADDETNVTTMINPRELNRLINDLETRIQAAIDAKQVSGIDKYAQGSFSDIAGTDTSVDVAHNLGSDKVGILAQIRLKNNSGAALRHGWNAGTVFTVPVNFWGPMTPYFLNNNTTRIKIAEQATDRVVRVVVGGEDANATEGNLIDVPFSAIEFKFIALNLG